ncbi:FAD binding domain [Lecanosticta acicola]|uniref:FAD binding domain n=1 Tax=Lecanosticta acicola TaxID=111012 RepID=A0AAI8YT49_9PEZI|nr:FAD binding domain [Lecanosticta acicola]
MSISSCCTQLASLPGLHVAFPNSTAYIATEKSYWSLQEGSLAPSCIVSPATAEDVVEIVSTIVRQGQCEFAIKGQGHAPAAGFANADHGVTIDLASLDSISLNEDHSLASVGAGARWVDAYAYLERFGKTVAGGRNGQVGVGGLTLGGGISYFSPQVGFTCDSVFNFEIVLASGRLVNTNATSHADLFRALKGGLNNFGVVTRIDLETLPIGEILGGSATYDISQKHSLFEAFANIANAPQYDSHASLVAAAAFNSTTKTWTLSSTPIYTKPDLNPPFYQELFAISNVSSTVQLRNLSTFSNESAIPQLNFAFFTGTYGVSVDFLERMFDIVDENVRSSSEVSWSYAIEPLPTIFTARGAGENVLGTSAHDGNGMIVLISPAWMDPALDAEVRCTGNRILSGVETAAKDMGTLRQFVYANYADRSQRPVISYGKDNQFFLKAVARKYDPSGVFQKLVPGGFKLDD